MIRHHVFALAGQFSTELDPHGHDLGGGEDSEYVLRTIIRRIRYQYAPDIVQHHYVNIDRLKVSYLAPRDAFDHKKIIYHFLRTFQGLLQ